LSYRGEAGRDSSEFEFRFHVTRVFFWTQSEILVNGVRLRYATLDRQAFKYPLEFRLGRYLRVAKSLPKGTAPISRYKV